MDVLPVQDTSPVAGRLTLLKVEFQMVECAGRSTCTRLNSRRSNVLEGPLVQGQIPEGQMCWKIDLDKVEFQKLEIHKVEVPKFRVRIRVKPCHSPF